MKKILLYSLPVLLAFVIGCGPGTNNPAPVNIPEGTFAGQFIYLHLHEKTGVIDTLKANIQLKMESTTGFQVTGDTSTLQAGSYGTYIFNSTNTAVDFMDKTYPATGTSTKIHLNGIYAFAFDGTTLQMQTSSAYDTLSYIYVLKKTGN
jgi:hypothetical protein